MVPVLFYRDVSCSWGTLLRLCKYNTAFVIFEYFTTNYRYKIKGWTYKNHFCDQLYQMNDVSYNLTYSAMCSALNFESLISVINLLIQQIE